MIRVPCPWCGPRNVTEFTHHGENGSPRPDTATTTPEEWRRYLYFRKNSNEWVDETWQHSSGCRRFFPISRNTTTNETATGSAK